MTPLGLGIVGTGNIAGGYARDVPTHPEIRLVAATDLDPERAAAFAGRHSAAASTLRSTTSWPMPTVDIVVNLTVHQAHHEVTKRALEAGRHVYSEKPLALHSNEARELVALAAARGLRLGCSPSTFLGEAQQTAAALIRGGRLGTVRAVYAEVNWGRIETWHPAPVPFFEVGALVDVGVYPLTLVTAMLGPARTVRAWGWDLEPDRVTIDGAPFRIGSPDLIVAAIELEGGAVVRLTASFYVGRPAKQTGSLEFHGDDASLALGSFQDFDATVEVGAYGTTYEPVTPVRPTVPRDRVGPWRGRDGGRDRRGPAAPRQRRAGRPRRRHPRGGGRIDGRRWTPRRDHFVVRGAGADALGGGRDRRLKHVLAAARPARRRPTRLPHDEDGPAREPGPSSRPRCDRRPARPRPHDRLSAGDPTVFGAQPDHVHVERYVRQGLGLRPRPRPPTSWRSCPSLPCAP